MTSILLGLVLVLLVVGFLWWLVDQIPVIAEPFKTIARGVLVFILVLYVIFVVARLFGVALPTRVP